MSDTPLFGPDDRVADVEALLRELDSADLKLVEPPSDVWIGIDAAIRQDELVHGDGAAVIPFRRRGSRVRATMISVAAALVLVAAGAAIVSSISGGADTAVASAILLHQPDFDPIGSDATATAQLVRRDGAYEIRLDDADLPDPDANDLELWLISTDDGGAIADVQPVSLVDAASPGTYRVPADLDPSVYSIVDISIEPRDGDETHSGRSILRGELVEA
jgi:Anti-sigma-K factor rskA